MEKNSNTVKAINKNVRSGARKINILLKNIRGKKVDVAIKNFPYSRFFANQTESHPLFIPNLKLIGLTF